MLAPRARSPRSRRGTLGKPAAAAAAMAIRTISAGMMARKPRSLFSPRVDAKSHEMMSPVPARQAKTAMANFSERGMALRNAAASAITPAIKAAGSSIGKIVSQ